MAFKYHREQFVDQLSNWSTQAVNNILRMGIMHRFPNLCLPETGISKAHKGGMKYCAEVIPYLPTTPECENVWRVRMTRLPSPLFRVFSSFVLIPCAAHAPPVCNWRCAKLFPRAPILGRRSCRHISRTEGPLRGSVRHCSMAVNPHPNETQQPPRQPSDSATI